MGRPEPLCGSWLSFKELCGVTDVAVLPPEPGPCCLLPKAAAGVPSRLLKVFIGSGRGFCPRVSWGPARRLLSGRLTLTVFKCRLTHKQLAFGLGVVIWCTLLG